MECNRLGLSLEEMDSTLVYKESNWFERQQKDANVLIVKQKCEDVNDFYIFICVNEEFVFIYSKRMMIVKEVTKSGFNFVLCSMDKSCFRNH